ncbi:hypothetical protein [Nannocystis sp.]|uniref:DUF7793 family protein n=1 Tax=Nannocystis sp. TaxID=1962667 RepID=UPI0024272B0D|nr:hypothetical protein [Nannocystis sp.]MBK7828825.1 hypothetical protein [Nannocystis sp.]MBK9756534.1 hypothetical protein [Nannocystis sp.]
MTSGDPAELVRFIDTSTSRYELRADGVIVQRVISTKTQTLADARENTAAFAALAAGGKHPLIVDMRSNFTTDRGVREHYASPEATAQCSAIALLTRSAAGRVIGNFFLALQSSDVPMRMFGEETDAFTWVRRVAPARRR